MTNRKYIHTKELHNLSSPREIVPVLMEVINPKSVVDVGCGVGTFLYAFKEAGVKNVLGIDGPWVNKELLNKYIDQEEFIEEGVTKDSDPDVIETEADIESDKDLKEEIKDEVPNSEESDEHDDTQMELEF